jgi:hypothetical protein
VSPEFECLVVVLGHRASMRRDGDAWAVSFREPAYGVFHFRGLASEALGAAAEYVRQVDAWGRQPDRPRCRRQRGMYD